MVVKYKKINDIQSMVYINGEHVGWLEKPFRTWFKLQLFYMEIEVPANKPKMVTPLIKKVYSRIKGREVRRIVGEQKLKNSIYNQYKIKE